MVATVMQAMKDKVFDGFTQIDGSYYYHEGQWYRGKNVISEEDMRRAVEELGSDELSDILSYIQEV